MGARVFVWPPTLDCRCSSRNVVLLLVFCGSGLWFVLCVDSTLRTINRQRRGRDLLWTTGSVALNSMRRQDGCSSSTRSVAVEDAASVDPADGLFVSWQCLALVVVCFVLGLATPKIFSAIASKQLSAASLRRAPSDAAQSEGSAVLPTGLAIEGPTQAPNGSGTTSVAEPGLQPNVPPANAPPTSLDEFRQQCDAIFDHHPLLPRWGSNATLSADYMLRAERMTCTKGRQLYRDFDSGEWTLPRGSTPLHQITDALVANNASGHGVVFHHRVAAITTTLLSLFHMLNDFVLPWPYVVEKLIVGKKLGPPDDWIERMPFDYVLLHVKGSLRGVHSDDVALMALQTLVGAGGALRPLIYGDTTDADQTVHCYCRSLLQAPAYLITYPKTAYLVEGDPERRRWTMHLKMKLNAQFGFVPYGTYPIPPSEYQPHGLWANTSYGPTVPRLLFYLRKRTRHIAHPEQVAALAASYGFNVQIFTAEDTTPLALQARAARYADVMMGMHGQALTWMAMMDNTAAPYCRELFELQHYGRSFKRVHNVYELLAADNSLVYSRVPSNGVVFDMRYVPNPRLEKKLLMKRSFPHDMLGFVHQTAFHDLATVGRGLNATWHRVSECVPRNRPVTDKLYLGEKVWKT